MFLSQCVAQEYSSQMQGLVTVTFYVAKGHSCSVSASRNIYKQFPAHTDISKRCFPWL